MQGRRLAAVFYLALMTCLALPSSSTPPPDDIKALQSASSGGLAALDRALVRLASHRRLLVIAAHPDDEDTTLLTAVARGQGGEAAYLSLSRGDGGQNLIGSEVGTDLGLLRSRELAAAREIDGARQYFSRAYDFGYTRSLDETLQRWPSQVLLEDAVRVVRRFKPQILMAVFPPTAAAGHGQHQASGWVAEQVFTLAADPAAFPHLLDEGLPPWHIDTFYRGAWWDPEAQAIEVPMGTIEPWSGRSILQIALASRSQHRCQDMGSIQPLGDYTGRLQWVAGRGGADQPLWNEIDTSLSAIAQVAAPSARSTLQGELEAVETLARQARSQLRADDQTAVRRALHDIVRRLRSSRGRLTDTDGAPSSNAHAIALLDEKLWLAQEALANASQILLDAVTETEIVVPGTAVEARSIFWNAGPGQVDDLQIEILAAADWQFLGSRPPEAEGSRFRTRVSDERLLRIAVPENASPSTPYFLAQPRMEDLYDWRNVAPEVRGEPFAPPPLRLRFRFDLDGTPVQLEREVVSRQRDQARGEIRRPLRIVPAVEISLRPSLRILPLGGSGPLRLQVDITSNIDQPQRLRLQTVLPAPWTTTVPPEGYVPPEVYIDQAFGKAQVDLLLPRPGDLEAGRYTLAVRAVDAAGHLYDASYPVIDYEHIRPTPRPQPATAEVVVADIRRPDLDRIGYVRGASDAVPELLAAIGMPIEVLSPEQLATGDLDLYDAIVVGSRAYEVDDALVRANARLLDYVQRGGLMIVQYQQYQFSGGGFAPYRLDIHRPHDRITDEDAAVELLQPEHAVFNLPNALKAEDWQGWVQERGLYFAGTWDAAYQPLMSMTDRYGGDGKAKKGGLIVASYGSGTYVYTGLAFFRQLPAGIPGAYRLFANLLSLAEKP